MKKFFANLLLVAMFASTPFVFTSCGDLFGMLEDIMQEMEDTENNDDEDNNYEGGDDYNEGYERETIEIEPYGVQRRNLLELCVNLTHEYKYTINGLDDCDWARIEWAQEYEGNVWTPLLTVDENTTGEPRKESFAIFLGENYICTHMIYQYP